MEQPPDSALAGIPGPAYTIRACQYCNLHVIWMETYIGGHLLCFNAQPIPKGLDKERTGWMLGFFMLGGKHRQLYAPWGRHSAKRRAQAQRVYQLHDCTGQHRPGITVRPTVSIFGVGAA